MSLSRLDVSHVSRIRLLNHLCKEGIIFTGARIGKTSAIEYEENALPVFVNAAHKMRPENRMGASKLM
jgi:hypothetical protein